MFNLEIFDFPPFTLLKLHFQHLIFAKIQYNDILSLINGFLQPYEILRAIICKNIFEGCFIVKSILRCYNVAKNIMKFEGCFIRRNLTMIFYRFLPFTLLKLHFQHLIFAKIYYNEFLSIIIGFLQPVILRCYNLQKYF